MGSSMSKQSHHLRLLLLLPVCLSLVLLFGYYGKSYVIENAKPISYSSYSVESLPLSDEANANLTKLGLTPKPAAVVRDANGFKRVVHGRFLHITDIHPDPYYKEGSNVEDGLCHGGKGSAGKYGDAVGGCDSPFALMEATIKWVSDNLKDKIDFIIWTGDNVRHDNDRRFPRTEMNIFELNQQVSDLMYTTFKNNDNPDDPRAMLVDLVPSLGNNDVYPHNLFAPGPTLQTRELFKIWAPFIPQSQLHVFNRGAYFFQEVIPGQLAVLSINTLYWFQSNPLVDNCDSKKEPGYKLFEWLSYVLKELRQRNMKVWLSGHVPPNEKNYDISCLRKYIIWTHEYRDIIIGGLYGHMNIDHFIPLDSKAAYKSLKEKYSLQEMVDNNMFDIEGHDSDDEVLESDNEDLSLEDHYSLNDVPIQTGEGISFLAPPVDIQGGVPHGKVNYLDTLRETLYATIKGKKKSGVSSERYSIAHVSASVVPTFNSGLRVWEYNISDLNSAYEVKIEYAPWDEFFVGLDTLIEQIGEQEDEPEPKYSTFKDQMDIFKKDKTIPPKMPKGLPLGPAYTPQLFTPERYVSYYADLKSINKGEKEFKYEIEYQTDDSVYEMENLTVDEWLAFGRKLGKPVKDASEERISKIKGKKNKKNKDKKKKKKNKEHEKLEDIWQHYLRYSFVNSGYENMNI
ncbi:endopolyphosphatase [[Candida] anglica]|uniref:Endopolyphosphatase n=1 Tax=[Candida] anglica TaxID=148631 RepID=A0ABP0E945_9ASCO